MIHIKKKIPACDPALVAALAEQSSATLHEAMGRIGALDMSIKPIARGMKLCGRAVTVCCHTADNIMLIKAASMIKPGDILVVNTGRGYFSGPFGEVLAVECQTRGIGGIVFDGPVRDSKELIEMGIAVFSAGLSIFGTSKATLGTINHPISFGGQIVYPGDIILGDDDGLVVIRHDEAQWALEQARKRVEKETAVIKRLKAGESLFDIYNYQKVFDALGCVEEED